MKTKFIQKNNTDKVILFFNGWGMDEKVIEHIDSKGFDVCVFQHYDKDFSVDIAALSSYNEIYLVAWSMGVWAAGKSLLNRGLKIKKSIAINGTLNPVDDHFGIPVNVFQGTIKHFSEINKQKFDRRMLDSIFDVEKYKNIGIQRSIGSQLTELKAIFEQAKDSEIDFHFDKAVIGNRDLIFPTLNQIEFWEEKTAIKTIDSAHFPFFKFKSWSEIVNL